MIYLNGQRVAFILAHAAAVIFIAAFFVAVGWSPLAGWVCGLVYLVAKEFGELVGRAKAAGPFKNTLAANAALMWRIFSEFWLAAQTFGAAVVAAGIMWFLEWLA